MSRRKRLLALVVIVIMFLILLQLVGVWSDFRWFAANGYGRTFWVLLLTRYGVGIIAMLVAFLCFWFNFWLIRRSLPNRLYHQLDNKVVELVRNPLSNFFSGGKGKWLFLAFSFLLALIIAAGAGSNWEIAQKFFYATPFGKADPIFGRDIGFYIFQLPFYELILSLLMDIFIIAIVCAAFFYIALASDEFTGGAWRVFSRVKLHLGALVAGILVLKAWDYRLSIYQLIYSPHTGFNGVGYTDIHARIPALQILMVLALLAAVFVCLGIFRGKIRPLLIGIGGLVVASLLLGSGYPYLVQKFQVEPNEFSSERPYLAYNMDFTRAAYGIDHVKSLDSISDTVAAGDNGTLDPKTLQSYRSTLINLRLWDFRPLAQVYNQIQQLRRYYNFNDVDIDRYRVGGSTRQLMLSARELNPDNLPDQAQTWVNKRLQYTHGFGAVANPVNEVTGDGLPIFSLEDIPPRATDPELKIERPEIYFGEMTSNMVVVNTKQGEFNYPKGDKNVYSSYRGHGGVQLSSWWRRLAYALRFQDIRLLLSSDITSQSRILYNRTVADASRLAPYLQYDSDPYLVISGGRLYWIRDAYTTSDHYPYAQTSDGINYIRNSVKVIIDAYQGDIRFYVSDPNDPLIKTYRKIYPDLYRPLNSMPAGLKAHLRYPEQLFKVQTSVYTLYHIDDPRVFYNREDEWAIPNEKFSDTTEQIQPYYAIMQLPGQSKEEFVLVLPYTPVKRDNLVAWMAARCDGEHYGELVIDTFTKDVHVYGPMQVEATIDQNADISGQLTLWNQHGSQVIRGNLITVPLAGHLLYIEPLFLQAQDSSLPQLTRVIAFFEGKVVMEKDLPTAINRLFNAGNVLPETPAVNPQPAPGVQAPPANQPNTGDLVKRANDLYQQAQDRLKAGDWSGYGKAINDLGQVLQQLAGRQGSVTTP